MFNNFKRFNKPGSTPPYEIVQCETKAFDSDEGIKHIIFLAANLNSASALDALIGDLVERFKVHRTISPPDTSMLLLTIIGPCEAPEVALKWRDRVAQDAIVQVWMSRMEKAEVGVVPVKGATSEEFHSLLSSA